MKPPTANPGDLVEINLEGKIYKSQIINNLNMFPSDPSGSLDVLFLNYKILGKKLWKKH